MKYVVRILPMLLFLFSALNNAFADQDMKGSKDHPFFNRMPNFYIEDYQESDFDSHEFTVNTRDVDYERVSVEGRKTYIFYRLNEGAKTPSSLQVVRNYQNAVQKIGGKLLWENTDPGNRILTLKLTKGGKESWIEVVAGGGEADSYTLTIVEKGELAQDITANDMLAALNKEGHIALYINFDTGKSIIKPESQPIIDQIVQMMKQNPNLEVRVEGHTDNVGNPKSNKTLSEERAKSVVSAIVKKGVDAKRLSATGFGQDKPVADNKTEEGRAKNRRVELVKK